MQAQPIDPNVIIVRKRLENRNDLPRHLVSLEYETVVILRLTEVQFLTVVISIRIIQELAILTRDICTHVPGISLTE